MANGKYIAYYRVSTDRQGRSGLGLEAQKQAVINYLNGGKWELLKDFIEVETGKNDARPQLQEALKACQLTGATLLIAKLDRLSRNLTFISSLMDSGSKFVCCDFPEANELMIQQMAIFAQWERKRISERTKEALKAAKSKGVKLGNPDNLKPEHAKKGRELGTKSRQYQADQFALIMKDTIKKYQQEGFSLNKIAKALNDLQIETPRKSGRWTAAAVKNLINRIESLKDRN